MRRTAVFVLLAALATGLAVQAQDSRRGTGKDSTDNPLLKRQAAPVRQNAPARQAVAARQPVVINLNRPSPGRNNQAFHPVQQPVAHQPSYGRLQWKSNPQPARSDEQPSVRQIQPTRQLQAQGVAGSSVNPALRAANVVHHHPYTQGYVRKKLQKIGVKTAPQYITDRAEIIATDRAHSTVRVPLKGPDNRPFNSAQVSPRHFNDDVVRTQISLVSGADYQRRIVAENARETQVGRYYWHQDVGFSYCHYIDGSGYHWYGWNAGGRFFWTRNYAGRWWWYDADFGRWNFWNDGYWWWQDPYHVGDLYCYNNDAYIPTNSADDQIVVTSTDQAGGDSYNSPDGTRVVKVVSDTSDAFLYDTANPPTFDPIYLASGVESVQFSDTSNGRPLEIVLKLKDGSFDMFDAQGVSYNPGRYDQDQANSAQPPNP